MQRRRRHLPLRDEKRSWDFKEALENLAERAGVKLTPLTPQRVEENERDVQLRKLLEEAVVFYRHQLTQTEEGQEAQAYLKKTRHQTRNRRSLGIGLRAQYMGRNPELFSQ
jgi:DNA primase